MSDHAYTISRPESGVRPIAKTALIDRELRAQGSSLEAFCAAYGTTPNYAAAVLRGARLDELLLVTLAERLGVSVAAITAA